MAIYFFREHGANGYLSNFFATTFEMDGHPFVSSEQAFMFAKCRQFDSHNADMLQAILNECDPKKVKKLGRRVRNYDDQVWNDVRYETMVGVLRSKFSYNAKIRNALLETGTKHLYEASPYDRIWGIGYGKDDALKIDPRKYGDNLLGKALMQVRGEMLQSK